MATPTSIIHLAPNPSESAALQGHKAKTPIIAGATAGACVALAWLVSLIIFISKRRKRRARARAAGLKSHRDIEKPLEIESQFIIPPDPAVVQGHRLLGPGLAAIDERKSINPSRANTDSVLPALANSERTEPGVPDHGRVPVPNANASSSAHRQHSLSDGALTPASPS